MSISVVTQEQKRAKRWKIFQEAQWSRLENGLDDVDEALGVAVGSGDSQGFPNASSIRLLQLLVLGTKCCCRGRSEKQPAALVSHIPRELPEKPPPAFQLSYTDLKVSKLFFLPN